MPRRLNAQGTHNAAPKRQAVGLIFSRRLPVIPAFSRKREEEPII